MTTAQKIISGFMVMIVLMLILAYVGYRGLSTSLGSFERYYHIANIDVLTTELHTEINMMVYQKNIFAQTGDPKAKKQAEISFDKANQMIKTLLALTTLPKSIKLADELSISLGQAEKSIAAFENNTTKRKAFFSSDLLALKDELEKSMGALASEANRNGDANALYLVSLVWADCDDLSLALSDYNDAGAEEDATLVKATLARMKTNITQIGNGLNLSYNVKIFEDIVKYHDQISNKFTVFQKLVEDSRKANELMHTQLDKISRSSLDLHKLATELRASAADTTSSKARSATDQMCIVLAIGLFFGIALAALISFNVIRTMRRLATFVTNITEGRFHADSGVTEKGAVGEILTAMHLFCNLLHGITTDTKLLASKVNGGIFRERFNTSNYTGGFSLIGNSVNLLADSYTNLIDSIPTPIMTCSADNTILFLNKEAIALIGRDKAGEKCYDVMATEACHTKNCFGNKTCHLKEKTAGHTSFMMGTEKIDIAVLAAPLYNDEGVPVAYVEIISNISDIKAIERLVAKTVGRASVLADRIAASSRQLDEEVGQITSGTEQQKSQVETTAIAMSGMNDTVLEIAQNANQASTQTDDTRQKADSGASLVNKVVSSINDIQNVAATLQTNMQELGTQANNIGSVMNVISDIADQTNLLALNAAIEAARAGESGRGFAVVADEVRKLAEKTMTATFEVGQSITAIQDSAKANIDAVNIAVSSVADATTLAHSSGEALVEIVGLTSSNSTIVAAIATSSSEQSSTSEEISHAIESINQIANDIALSMEHATVAVADLSGMAQELHDLMDKLSVKK